MKRLESLNERWVRWVRNIPVLRVMGAWVWARTEGGTYTAIAANFSVVAVLAYEAARVAYGNHDGE